MGYSIFVAMCVVGVFLACTAVVSVFLLYGGSQSANGAWEFKQSVYQPMPMLTRRAPAPPVATAPAAADTRVAANRPVAAAA